MNLFYRCIGTLVAVVLILASALSAGDGVQVSVVMTVAKQDDSPVQVMGFKLPAQVGGLPAIVVRNTTSKEIRHVGLANLLGNPSRLRKKIALSRQF